ADLTLAAVHHQQVRQRLGFAPREPPLDHLAQTGDVVASLGLADAVAAIAGLVGPSVRERDAAGDRERAAERRDVVALDAARQAREAEALLQLGERRGHALARLDALGEAQRGVGVRHRHQVAKRAALRDADLHAPPRALGQELAERLALRRLER